MRPIMRRSLKRWLLLALALCLGAESASASKDSVPDWVRAAAQQTVPHYPPDTDAVVLLDDTTVTVSADGHAVEHRRRVVVGFSMQALDEGDVIDAFGKVGVFLADPCAALAILLKGIRAFQKRTGVAEEGLDGGDALAVALLQFGF